MLSSVDPNLPTVSLEDDINLMNICISSKIRKKWETKLEEF